MKYEAQAAHLQQRRAERARAAADPATQAAAVAALRAVPDVPGVGGAPGVFWPGPGDPALHSSPLVGGPPMLLLVRSGDDRPPGQGEESTEVQAQAQRSRVLARIAYASVVQVGPGSWPGSKPQRRWGSRAGL
jgi:hypothetical protein